MNFKIEVDLKNDEIKSTFNLIDERLPNLATAYKYYKFLFKGFSSSILVQWADLHEGNKEAITYLKLNETKAGKTELSYLRDLKILKVINDHIGDQLKNIGIDLSIYPSPKFNETDIVNINNLYKIIKTRPFSFSGTSKIEDSSDMVIYNNKLKGEITGMNSTPIKIFNIVFKLNIFGEGEVKTSKEGGDKIKINITFEEPKFKIEKISILANATSPQ